MIKKPETMRDRAHNLAQEAIIFGRLGGRTWDGLASLFVTFAEAEIERAALSASGAGVDSSPRKRQRFGREWHDATCDIHDSYSFNGFDDNGRMPCTCGHAEPIEAGVPPPPCSETT
jgi:hypothetical protein